MSTNRQHMYIYIQRKHPDGDPGPLNWEYEAGGGGREGGSEKRERQMTELLRAAIG